MVILSVFAVGKMVGLLASGSKDYKSLTKRSNISFDDSNKFTRIELDELRAANVFRTDQVIKTKDPVK
ncbi:MAG: hypothetical protein JKY52_20830 [Flavobacteriales bacterium]|nr:hypothetical protein [Flavobacteriales bacterium]